MGKNKTKQKNSRLKRSQRRAHRGTGLNVSLEQYWRNSCRCIQGKSLLIIFLKKKKRSNITTWFTWDLRVSSKDNLFPLNYLWWTSCWMEEGSRKRFWSLEHLRCFLDLVTDLDKCPWTSHLVFVQLPTPR